MLKTNHLFILFFVAISLANISCEIIGINSSNDPSTIPNPTIDPQGVYYQHFVSNYGQKFLQTFILDLQDQASMLRELQTLRISNVNITKTFLSQRYPSVLEEIQAANIWNSLPATQLPYLVLSKLNKVTESQRVQLLSNLRNMSTDSVLKSFDNILQLKKLMKNLFREFYLESQLRMSADQSIGRLTDSTFQDTVKILLQKDATIKSKISQQFLNEFNIQLQSSSDENSTVPIQPEPEVVTLKSQLQTLFGQSEVASYLRTFPEKLASMQFFDLRRNQINNWYKLHRNNFSQSDLKLYLGGNDQPIVYTELPSGKNSVGQVFPFDNFINFRRIFDYELRRIEKTNVTITETLYFYENYWSLFKVSVSLRLLLDQGSEIYQSVRNYWRNLKLKQAVYLQAIAYKNANLPPPGYVYEGECSSNPGLGEIKLSKNIYYGNKKITWSELVQYNNKISKNYTNYWKVLDYYFDDWTDAPYTGNTFHSKQKQVEYREMLTINGITDEEFRRISKTYTEFAQVKILGDEGEIIYDCAHTILALEESDKTFILFV